MDGPRMDGVMPEQRWTLKVNGRTWAEGQVPISAPLLFTANDCLDIGIALGSPVSLDYFDRTPFKFNGTIHSVGVRYVPVTATTEQNVATAGVG